MIRPVKLAKFGARRGWDITVLAAADDAGPADPRLVPDADVEVVRAREWELGRLLGFVGGALRRTRQAWERRARSGPSHPSLLDRGFAYEEQEIEASKVGWVLPALRVALAADRRRPVDVAVVSLPPAAAGSVGWLLHRLRGIPYVVEYRDPWTVGAFWAADADGRPRTDPVTRARRAVTTRLEAALLRGAAGSVIVNGDAHVDRLAASFAGHAGKPIAHIRNGVDLDDLVGIEPRPASPGAAPLRLLHTGFFYHFYTPHHLITALRLVQEDHPDVLAGLELEFMGGGFPEPLLGQLETWGLGGLVRCTEAGSYSEALEAMHAADGLVVVLPPLASDRDRLPTKVYEYLGTDRPILAVVDPAGAAARLLEGVPDAVVADNGDQTAIAEGIVAFAGLVRRRRAEGSPPECRERGRAHAYEGRAEQMDAFLRRVVAAGPPASGGRRGRRGRRFRRRR